MIFDNYKPLGSSGYFICFNCGKCVKTGVLNVMTHQEICVPTNNNFKLAQNFKETQPETLVVLFDFCEYEVTSSWFAKYISNPTIQEWLGSYFAWKAKRKYNRYLHYLKVKKQLNSL